MTEAKNLWRQSAPSLVLMLCGALSACGGGTPAGDAGNDTGSSSQRLDVCALVSAMQAATLLGMNVERTSREVGDLDPMGIAAPGCSYGGPPPTSFAVVYALDRVRWEGYRDASFASASIPLTDLGEEAWVRLEPFPPMLPAKVVEIGARSGGRYIHARIFAGVPEAQARAFVSAFLPR